MRLKTLLKLIFGFILVTALCIAAVNRLQEQEGKAVSRSAAIQAHRDTIGIDYAGTITKQFIEPGQSVVAGQQLFYVKSTVLSDQLRDQKVDINKLGYQLTDSGEIIIAATKPGIIDSIFYTGGSFVPANQTLATLIDTDSYVVKSDFVLSSKQFSRLGDNPEFDILIGQNQSIGNIRSVSTQTGKADTVNVTITASFSNPPKDVREGLAVRSVLRLNHTTFKQKLAVLWSKI